MSVAASEAASTGMLPGVSIPRIPGSVGSGSGVAPGCKLLVPAALSFDEGVGDLSRRSPGDVVAQVS